MEGYYRSDALLYRAIGRELTNLGIISRSGGNMHYSPIVSVLIPNRDLAIESRFQKSQCQVLMISCMSGHYVGQPVGQQELTAFIDAAERLGNRFWLHFAFWVSEFEARLRGDWESARQFSDRGLTATPGWVNWLTRLAPFPRQQIISKTLLRFVPRLAAGPNMPGPAGNMRPCYWKGAGTETAAGRRAYWMKP